MTDQETTPPRGGATAAEPARSSEPEDRVPDGETPRFTTPEEFYRKLSARADVREILARLAKL